MCLCCPCGKLVASSKFWGKIDKNWGKLSIGTKNKYLGRLQLCRITEICKFSVNKNKCDWIYCRKLNSQWLSSRRDVYSRCVCIWKEHNLNMARRCINNNLLKESYLNITMLNNHFELWTTLNGVKKIFIMSVGSDCNEYKQHQWKVFISAAAHYIPLLYHYTKKLFGTVKMCQLL